MKTLRLILGDQLNIRHSWFAQPSSDVLYVMMEIRAESEYVTHHIQKLVLFFAAMRAFADQVESLGHKINYIKLDDPANLHSFEDNLRQILQSDSEINHLEWQEPDEFRLDALLSTMPQKLGVSGQMVDSEHFLASRNEVKHLFAGRKTYLMETFYRMMRKKHRVMMEGNEPMGGKWNFDHENRAKFNNELDVPTVVRVENDVKSLVDMIHKAKLPYIGEIDASHFIWPITRKQAKQVLKHFLETALPWFGTWQDAMHSEHPWLFHSRLSAAMNLKLLSPKEVIDAAVATWQAYPEQISINQIEGFVRQILGWREYMRGIYWAEMPQYAAKNFFNHNRKLPNWFWTGDTKMNCLRHAVGQSLELAYAHHIQRLMVTGNFALLAGIDPDEVDAWYLGIYIDAIEWVEITNTRGMSQFADGGIVGSKPYVSSANYLQKMSNYCDGCAYNPKLKTGEGACPFNSLYWHFYARNEDKLAKNPRIGMMYRTWEKMDPNQKEALLNQAEMYLEHIEML